MHKLFDDCIRDIKNTYKQLDHKLGWRFLYVSRAILDSPVDIALITTHPGGNEIRSDHPEDSCEHGIAYLAESWADCPPGESPLQKQVRAMFSMLNSTLELSEPYEELMARSLLSHVIPFRAPEFDKMPCKEESFRLGRSLWQSILPKTKPRLIICLGRETQAVFNPLIKDVFKARHSPTRFFSTGWGKLQAEIDDFSGPDHSVRVLYLPHLSRYSLFTSSKCMKQMSVIIHEACHGVRWHGTAPS